MVTWRTWLSSDHCCGSLCQTHLSNMGIPSFVHTTESVELYVERGRLASTHAPAIGKLRSREGTSSTSKSSVKPPANRSISPKASQKRARHLPSRVTFQNIFVYQEDVQQYRDLRGFKQRVVEVAEVRASLPALVEQGRKQTVRIKIDGAGEFEAARVRRHEGGVEIGAIDVQHRNWSSGWKDLNALFCVQGSGI
ncbi:hypothetical protein AGR4A_Lc40703 [Agrobacterium tumefaciens str. B6]|uniref:Uncharacterized protein n=1 Tax=Agrobacterium tumefaciens str. B6 TaxID=1183423 RepID=A0A822V839_AGRTU|nr:hypothetical protein AGR4A_Lc40703 [Agrobacterium tumefaciens str. B6]